MYNGKYVNIETIIEKVFRDNGYETELDFYDVIEWAGEAMDLIGASLAFVNKITNGDKDNEMSDPITIENYRGVLPCDLHIVTSCRDYDNKIPMINMTDTYGKGYSGDKLNNFATPNQYNYYINDSYIFSGKESHSVEMAYMAYPVDKRGFPMIPDNTSYIKAIQHYVQERLDFKLWRQGKINQAIYEKSNQEWLWYVGKAKNSIDALNVDRLESIKNQLVRLVRNDNYYNTFFSGLGNQQNINLGKSKLYFR